MTKRVATTSKTTSLRRMCLASRRLGAGALVTTSARSTRWCSPQPSCSSSQWRRLRTAQCWAAGSLSRSARTTCGIAARWTWLWAWATSGCSHPAMCRLRRSSSRTACGGGGPAPAESPATAQPSQQRGASRPRSSASARATACPWRRTARARSSCRTPRPASPSWRASSRRSCTTWPCRRTSRRRPPG